MPPLRRTADIPGLARLLADVPRDRRVALAASWDAGSPDQPGFIAALYRSMTDRGKVGGALDRCSEIERRLFASLLAVADGRTPVDLASQLPFSDQAILDGLHSLEERGLVWKVAAPGRGQDADGARWAVPRDLATNLGPEWRASRGARNAEVVGLAYHATSLAPRVDRLTLPAEALPTAGSMRRLLMSLVDGDAIREEATSIGARAESIAWSWGVALGILTQKGRSISPGARAAIWKGLNASDQTRALARLWLVNSSVSTDVPMAARSAMAVVLAALEEDVWYGFDSFARVVASRIAERPGLNPPDDSTSPPLTPGRLLRRAELERAIETLSAIGVVEFATDERHRPVALRKSPAGKYALA